jgi:hypothetical protein
VVLSIKHSLHLHIETCSGYTSSKRAFFFLWVLQVPPQTPLSHQDEGLNPCPPHSPSLHGHNSILLRSPSARSPQTRPRRQSKSSVSPTFDRAWPCLHPFDPTYSHRPASRQHCCPAPWGSHLSSWDFPGSRWYLPRHYVARHSYPASGSSYLSSWDFPGPRWYLSRYHITRHSYPASGSSHLSSWNFSGSRGYLSWYYVARHSYLALGWYWPGS